MVVEIHNQKLETSFGNSVDEIRKFLDYLTESQFQVIEEYIESREIQSRLLDLQRSWVEEIVR